MFFELIRHDAHYKLCLPVSHHVEIFSFILCNEITCWYVHKECSSVHGLIT